MAVSAVTAVPFYRGLSAPTLTLESRSAVVTFFAVWIVAFTAEYFVLGRYSFIAMVSEGNFAIAVDRYLTRLHDGGIFAHEFAGGQDLYVMYAGMQYVQPEILLFRVAPTWLVIWVHKLMVAGIGFAGSYLLARRMAPDSRSVAVAVAALFPLTHTYLLTYSTSFAAAGLATIPLAVYAAVCKTREPGFWPWVAGTSVVLAVTDPVHVYPPLAVAVVGALILFPGAAVRRTAAALACYVVAAVANWHEVLYGLASVATYTNRGDGGGVAQVGFADALVLSIRALLWMAVPTLVLASSLLVFLARRDVFVVRTVAAIVWVPLSYALAKSMPWEAIGLAQMRGVEFLYMGLAWPALMIPIAAKALAGFAPGAAGRRWPRRPEAVVLAAALALLVWHKFANVAQFLWFGGQSAYFGHESLNDPPWRPDFDFRVVTLFDTPHPNIVSGYYGYDSFDGGVNLNHRAWQEFWLNTLYNEPNYLQTTRPRIEWEHWDGTAYEVGRHLRLDLLAIANVHYLFSALPLRNATLRPVFEPEPEDRAKALPDDVGGWPHFLWFRLRRIFDPGELYVYEIANSLPRVFAARTVTEVADDIASETLHDRIASVAGGRGVVVASGDRARLGTPSTSLRVLSAGTVADGYDIAIDAPDGGILVVNQMHLPFWEARAGTHFLDIVPVNGVHMAMSVPPGATRIEVRYRRPLLREKVAGVLGWDSREWAN